MTQVEQEIYRLVDPFDGTTHYIGRSRNAAKRFKQHLHCDGVNQDKDEWIQSLQDRGTLPLLIIVEKVNGTQSSHRREAYWIYYYLARKHPLANLITDELVAERKAAQLQVLTEDIERLKTDITQTRLAVDELERRVAA